MRVEYDEALKEFRIYKADFDSSYTTANYSGEPKEIEVMSDDRFRVVGKFGDVSIFDTSGRIVA